MTAGELTTQGCIGHDDVQLDIVIPAYNEGENIIRVVDALRRSVCTQFRVLVCYDDDKDTTLSALLQHPRPAVVAVRNRGRGAFGAVMTGFAEGSARMVLVYPADDDFNAARIDAMVKKVNEGYEIVCASRFMKGGSMTGCPPLKWLLVRASAFTLHHFAGLPTHDPSNGLRLFSRRVLDSIPLESSEGFTYSIELLVKCHRLGWPVCELPAEWHERKLGRSHFHVIRWLPHYLRWYVYAFSTRCLRRGPATVSLREAVDGPFGSVGGFNLASPASLRRTSPGE